MDVYNNKKQQRQQQPQCSTGTERRQPRIASCGCSSSGNTITIKKREREKGEASEEINKHSSWFVFLNFYRQKKRKGRIGQGLFSHKPTIIMQGRGRRRRVLYRCMNVLMYFISAAAMYVDHHVSEKEKRIKIWGCKKNHGFVNFYVAVLNIPCNGYFCKFNAAEVRKTFFMLISGEKTVPSVCMLCSPSVYRDKVFLGARV